MTRAKFGCGMARCAWLQVSCLALAVSLMLASFPSLAQDQEKERSVGHPTFYRTTQIDGLSIFYREAGAKGCADASPAAWISLFIADVRASLCPALRSLSPGRARLPGLRTQRLAGPENIRIYVRPLGRDHESLRRSARAHALHALHAGLRRPGGFSHGLGPSGADRGSHRSGRCRAQRRPGALWKPRRAFWADRAANESALRANFLSLATTRTRHLGSDPNADRYDPDLWTDEFAFLSKPGQADIQADLFYDYRTNVDAYPKWQAWLRATQPRLLVLWGKYDPSFEVSEAEAYRRDVPKAEVHVLDAGHFALDTAADQIAELVRSFMK